MARDYFPWSKIGKKIFSYSHVYGNDSWAQRLALGYIFCFQFTLQQKNKLRRNLADDFGNDTSTTRILT